MTPYAALALQNGGLNREQARELLQLPEAELLASATALREHCSGKRVEACYIINAKSGNCNMNCKFCSQSGFNSTDIEHYPFKSAEDLAAIIESWEPYPVGRCGIVTSGGALTDDDVEKLARYIETRSAAGKKTARRPPLWQGQAPRRQFIRLLGSGYAYRSGCSRPTLR